LNQAIFLQPDLAQAHFNLGWLYREMGYFDLALSHLQTHRQLIQQAGPPSGLSAEQFREQDAQFEKELEPLVRAVADAEKKYAGEATGLRVVNRALLAAQWGLAGKARDMLLESDWAAFGRRGMALELELQLKTGRAKEVREWTDLGEDRADQKAALGTSYYWLRAQALAASGDYALAEEELAQLASHGRNPEGLPPRKAMARVIGEAILNQQPGPGPLASLLEQAFFRGPFQSDFTAIAQKLRQEADATVLRGLLALEEGDVDEADVAFRLSLELWKDETTAASGGGLDFGGRVIAQACLEWLEQAKRGQ
jgi:tetratricopeptide (TPR) repeat protein